MNFRTLYFLIPILFVTTSCNSNTELNKTDTDSNLIKTNSNQNSSNVQINDNFLSLKDLMHLVSKDNLTRASIESFLKEININWKYKGVDKQEILFAKDNNEASKEVVTYHFKDYMVEDVFKSKNHFLSIIRSLKDNNFVKVKSAPNKDGDVETIYKSDNFILETIEYFFNEDDIYFKILITQKR